MEAVELLKRAIEQTKFLRDHLSTDLSVDMSDEEMTRVEYMHQVFGR